MTNCNHAKPLPGGQAVTCSLGLYGGQPSLGVCLQCKSYEGPSRGLGDTVKNFIQVATAGLIKPCQPCEARRLKLNQLFPHVNQ